MQTRDYNPDVIYEFAGRLYSKAEAYAFAYMLIGGITGGLIGAAVSQAVALISLVVVGALGFWYGNEKGFVLKLQAQTALCQARIEENTRRLKSLTLDMGPNRPKDQVAQQTERHPTVPKA